MPLACPKCHSRFLRDSHPRTLKEKLGRLWFVSPLRCKDCQNRFVTSTLILADLWYARCPTCYRMDLNGWTGRNYTPPFWTGLKIKFGAKRYRCEYCRFNFSSFRKRWEAFTFKRWEKMKAGEARAENLAKHAERRTHHRGETLEADFAGRTAPAPPAGRGERDSSNVEERVALDQALEKLLLLEAGMETGRIDNQRAWARRSESQES